MEIPEFGKPAEVHVTIEQPQFMKLLGAVNLVGYLTGSATPGVAEVMEQINRTPRRQELTVEALLVLADFAENIIGPRVDIRRQVERELGEI